MNLLFRRLCLRSTKLACGRVIAGRNVVAVYVTVSMRMRMRIGCSIQVGVVVSLMKEGRR